MSARSAICSIVGIAVAVFHEQLRRPPHDGLAGLGGASLAQAECDLYFGVHFSDHRAEHGGGSLPSCSIVKWQNCHHLGEGKRMELQAEGSRRSTRKSTPGAGTILGVLCLSLLIVMIANTSLNVALPTLSRELGATSSQLQWMVDAYSLVFAGLLFTAGATSATASAARASSRPAWWCSARATATPPAWSRLAPAHRCPRRHGLGGAMVMPATLSILTNVFPREERARAVAMWAGISGARHGDRPGAHRLRARALLGWNAVFAVNMPFVVAAMIGGRLSRAPRAATPSTQPSTWSAPCCPPRPRA